MARSRVLVSLVLLVFAAACASLGGGASERGPRTSLRILLTNDDGFESAGIRAVKEALVAAGHRVTIVAPAENRSGSGSSLTTSGGLGLRKRGEDIWSVAGTPADAVRVGLLHVLADEPVDLVVSGANFGQNIGPSTLVSGTVGAALAAMQLGVPAIAISVGVNVREARDGFPSTLAAFPAAAALTAAIVDRLDGWRTRDGDLLPPHTAINVNHPAGASEGLKGVAYATIGRDESFRILYDDAPGGADAVVLRFAHGDDVSLEGTDTALFAEGYATISVLDGDLLAERSTRRRIEARLGELRP